MSQPEAPPVDLIPPENLQTAPAVPPPEQPEPIPPMTPPVVPKFNLPAQPILKAGQPVTQETHVKQTIYPGGPNSNPNGGFEGGVVPLTRKEQTAVQYINSLAMDGTRQQWTLRVSRLGPPKWNHTVIPIGIVEDISPPLDFNSITERIREIHGGGKYLITVIEDNGVVTRITVPFQINTLQYPPIINTPGSGFRTVGSPQSPNQSLGGAFSDAFNGGNEELTKLRNAEAVARAKKSVVMAEHEAKEAERVAARRERAEIEQEERRQMQPELQSVRTEMKEMFMMMAQQNKDAMQQFRELLLLQSGKKEDNGQMYVLLAEMMKASTQQMVGLVTALGASRGGGMEEVYKLVAASNEKVTQLAMENTRSQMASFQAAASKNDKLLESLILAKLEHPDNAVKQALELQETGWKKAMEVMEMRGGNEPDEVIDPESGFWGNLGNVVLAGLQRLFSRGVGGAGKQMFDIAASMLNKAPGTTNFSQNDLQQLSNAIVQQQKQNVAQGLPINIPTEIMQAARPAAALPAPAATPPVQQPQRPVRRLDPYKIFDRVYEVEPLRVQPAPVAPPIQTAIPAVPPVVPPVVEEVEDVTRPNISSVAQPEEVDEDPIVGETLEDCVNQALTIMLSDFKRGQQQQQWVEYALSNWDEAFLNEIATATDDSARVKIIQTKADPGLYDQVYSILASNPKVYMKFEQNMKEFVQEILSPEPANASAE